MMKLHITVRPDKETREQLDRIEGLLYMILHGEADLGKLSVLSARLKAHTDPLTKAVDAQQAVDAQPNT